MKKTILLFATTVLTYTLSAQIFLAKESEISFFSSAPVENITAVHKAAKPILNASTGDIQVKILIQGFHFEKPLMQEHFNENYMESDKYPDAIFKGKVNEKVDYTKDGTNKVTVTGKLNMHGVEKEVTIDGTIIVKGTQLLLDGKFMVHLADYNIKIPKVVVKSVAEDIEIKIKSTLEPFKK